MLRGDTMRDRLDRESAVINLLDRVRGGRAHREQRKMLAASVKHILDRHIEEIAFDPCDTYEVDNLIKAAQESPQHFRVGVQCPACLAHTATYNTAAGDWGCTKCGANGGYGTYWESLRASAAKRGR